MKEAFSYTNAGHNTNRVGVTHGSPTRGPPACTKQPEATFVNYVRIYVCTIKITQHFRRFGIPLTVIFLSTAHDPARNNRRGHCHKFEDPRCTARKPELGTQFVTASNKY